MQFYNYVLYFLGFMAFTTALSTPQSSSNDPGYKSQGTPSSLDNGIWGGQDADQLPNADPLSGVVPTNEGTSVTQTYGNGVDGSVCWDAVKGQLCDSALG